MEAFFIRNMEETTGLPMETGFYFAKKLSNSAAANNLL